MTKEAFSRSTSSNPLTNSFSTLTYGYPSVRLYKDPTHNFDWSQLIKDTFIFANPMTNLICNVQIGQNEESSKPDSTVSITVADSDMDQAKTD